MTNEKNYLNVGLIGMNKKTAAFVKSVVAESIHPYPPEGRFPIIGPEGRFTIIGGISASEIRFASLMSIAQETHEYVGSKLSTMLYANKSYKPKIIQESVLESKLEMTGGNPNATDNEESSMLVMGGQNPIMCNIFVNIEFDEEDRPTHSLNMDLLHKFITGNENPAAKSDVVIISLNDTGSLHSVFKLEAITTKLAELGVPFFIVEGDRKYEYPDVYYGDLPRVAIDLHGVIYENFMADRLYQGISESGLEVRIGTNSEVNLPPPTKKRLVNGYIEVGTLGTGTAEFTFSYTYEPITAFASTIFDVIRFLYTANLHNIQGSLSAVNRVYKGAYTHDDMRELNALAQNDLMALGEFYSSKDGKFTHK